MHPNIKKRCIEQTSKNSLPIHCACYLASPKAQERLEKQRSKNESGKGH